MPGSSAGEEQHPPVTRGPRGPEELGFERERAGLQRDLSSQGFGQSGRLLVDFLQHEMAVAPLLGGHRIPQKPVRDAFDRAALGIADPDPRGVHAGQVPLLQEDDVLRPRRERHGIGGDVVLSVADPEHDRRTRARRDEDSGLGARGHDDRVGAGQASRRGAHGGEQVPLERGLDLVSEDLGIGLAREAVSGGGQRRLAFREVLEDPVVDHGDLPGAVGVRVRVGFRGPSVGRPPRVSDARGARGRRTLQAGEQPRKLAGAALDGDGAVGERRDPSRIVAAILEPLEPFDEHRRRLPWSDISHDAAHDRDYD